MKTEHNIMTTPPASSMSLFSKKFVCVWTLPRGSKPIVRVEASYGQVMADKLFDIACSTLGLNEKSKPFFALFRGVISPSKRYSSNEIVYLPCKTALSIQKWSFDIVAETKAIRTDAVAFRLLALQVMSDIELGKFKLTNEELKMLEDATDPEFSCHKKYVEAARQIKGYDSVTIRDVEVMQKVKIVSTTLDKGTKVDFTCSPRKLTITSKTFVLSIPWRKIRRFAEIAETRSIGFEIFLADDKAFLWLEIKTPQSTLLLQMTAEFIDRMRIKLEKPEFPQPKWITEPKVNKLSWKIIKSEIFGLDKEKQLPVLQTFDGLDVSSSSDDDDDNNDDAEGVSSYATSRRSKRSCLYKDSLYSLGSTTGSSTSEVQNSSMQSVKNLESEQLVKSVKSEMCSKKKIDTQSNKSEAGIQSLRRSMADLSSSKSIAAQVATDNIVELQLNQEL